MAKTSKAKLEYIRQYDRERTTMLSVKLHKDHDADIIERLGEVDSKQAYVKTLIRADIEHEV